MSKAMKIGLAIIAVESVAVAGRSIAGAGREAGSASPMHYKTRELKRSAQAVLAAFSFLMGPDSSVGPRFEPW